MAAIFTIPSLSKLRISRCTAFPLTLQAHGKCSDGIGSLFDGAEQG
jgi:hypothetical protein